MKRTSLLTIFLFLVVCFVYAQRVPVLNQIDLPHDYYFRELYLPQMTNGPSSVSWSPSGKNLVYSMRGSLWLQHINEEIAIQITDGDGYDYQPDWSFTGNEIVFVRYNGTSVELMVYDLMEQNTYPLTNNNAVNVEPRWSPDGSKIVFVSTNNSGHFLLHSAEYKDHKLTNIQNLIPDTKSNVKRYYYSVYDHAINPTWSKDGKKIFFVSNHEIAHGTGDLVAYDLSTKEITTIQHEETNWRTKPEVSPDGTRIVYSSYLGRNWHQLWILPVEGGYPIPLTYGEYDNLAPRWSPSGDKIAFVSNRNGDLSIWTIDPYYGKETQLKVNEYQYLFPRSQYSITIMGEDGYEIPARVSITDEAEKFYAPTNAWIHADDSRYPDVKKFESLYFHVNENFTIDLPVKKIHIEVTHGPAYEHISETIDLNNHPSKSIELTLKRRKLPIDLSQWQSGDLHVHMNYGGNYLNTVSKLAFQAEAEDVNYIYNLIVNKEQRVPDINQFIPAPMPLSRNTMIMNSQEFHTSFWGHLGLLNLKDNVIIPGYVGYPKTAVESLFPNNGNISDKAHEQNGFVGYVHPYDKSQILPEQSNTLFNELPVDAALRKVDYYELVGFADHKASEKVWYELLNCGLHIPAGAGTDAMANYASLRGHVGLNRVYTKRDRRLDEPDFLKKVMEGKSFVTNGPILGMTLNGKESGDSISISKKGENLSYTAFLRSQVPIDHFEIIYNGEVVASPKLTGDKMTADIKGTIKAKESGWILLRAWSEKGNPELFDIYPYSSTNPIYITSPIQNSKLKQAAEYFIKWVNRIDTKLPELSFRTETEQSAVKSDIEKAKQFYQSLQTQATNAR